MVGLGLQARFLLSSSRPPSLAVFDPSPSPAARPRSTSLLLRYRYTVRSKSLHGVIRAASNVNIGQGAYEDPKETDSRKNIIESSTSDAYFKSGRGKPLSGTQYLLSVAAVLIGCSLVFAAIAFSKSAPAALISAFAKSGLTAAFTLIFVSEIGDKTFFIAALLAMQYDKALVLFGSMGALSLMTILSVGIGRMFHSVPAQFQTTVPIGVYGAVALLIFFGFKSIKDAWELPSDVSTSNKDSPELGELVEAEELVKAKVAKKLTSPLEIIWKSFSLVFFCGMG